MKYFKSPSLAIFLLASAFLLEGCKEEKKETLYKANVSGPVGKFMVYGFGPDVPCILWSVKENESPPLMSTVYIRKHADGKMYLVCEGKENGTEIKKTQSFSVIPSGTPFSW